MYDNMKMYDYNRLFFKEMALSKKKQKKLRGGTEKMKNEEMSLIILCF